MKLQRIRDGVGRAANIINYASLVPLFLLVFLVAVDVILRKLGVGRIDGSNELTTNFMVWICVLGIPVLQYSQGHIWVNLLVNKFPYRFRCFWRCVIMAVETAVIALLVIGGYEKVKLFLGLGTATDILRIPRWIFAIAVLISFVEYFVLSLIDTIQLCIDGVKGKEDTRVAGWSEDEVKGI